MMRRTLWLVGLALLVTPMAARAQDDKNAEARKLAQDILDKGATLFDTRDAKAMAATFAEDGEIILYGQDNESEPVTAKETRRGKAAIESAYADLFKDRDPSTKSRNIVEFAHFVGNDVLIIHGTFQLDTANTDTVPFVQIRTRRGEKWLVLSMQLFVVKT